MQLTNDVDADLEAEEALRDIEASAQPLPDVPTDLACPTALDGKQPF